MQLCTEQEQLRLLLNECHRLNSADVGAGQTHLAFVALEPPRVAASHRKLIHVPSSSIVSLCKCNRGLACQLSCAKYPRLNSWRQPNGPGIISCTRITVATLWPQDLDFPPSSDAIRPACGTEYRGRPGKLPRATIICRCNQHTAMGCQVTWSRLWSAFPCESSSVSQAHPSFPQTAHLQPSLIAHGACPTPLQWMHPHGARGQQHLI
jgi:hypothetical protein